MKQPLWIPSNEHIFGTSMTAFLRDLEEKSGQRFPDYNSAHSWSVDNPEAFWELYLNYSQIRATGVHEKTLSSRTMPGCDWFKGLRLNFAQNLLQDHSGIAITSVVEGKTQLRQITFAELRGLVARCARSLKDHGVRPGDRVAGYIANVPEAIVASLACATIGATWSSASPDFGPNAILDRLGQVNPKIVFASTHYRYGGKIFRTGNVLDAIRAGISSVETLVSVPYPDGESHIEGDLDWDDFLGADDKPAAAFEQLPFDHPLYIMFSSGTTGAPKCMVHGAGGTLLQHKKEQQLHCNLDAGSRLLYFTTCGWMMWNWQLSALALGTTLCLYDGHPGYPDLSAIWRLVDELGITHFGTGGRFIESCMKSRPSVVPENFAKFDSLESILYTGSPLSENGFGWIYENVKADVHLAGISGGTDILSCFVLGNPNLPVFAGEIQCKGLGVDVAAFDENGNPVSGEPGELVCRLPIPSMPVRFLNDPDGQKYHDAYFDVYPGIWRHGDYVEFTENGGVIIQGRSDATLNPGGVRIGSAEIYAALEIIPEIAGAVVVGWVPPAQNDEVIVLLVCLQPRHDLTPELKKKIRQTVREKTSPRHVPKHIFRISAVPATRSGKTVELSVKAILAGKSAANRSAVANPEVLDEIARLRQYLQQRHAAGGS